MKKYIIIIIAVTVACLALCAAVWPKAEVVEETPAPLQIGVVSAPAPTVEDDVEIAPPTEEEATEIPQAETPSEVAPEPEPVPEEVAVGPEVQPTPESEPGQESAPAPISVPASPQAVVDPQSGDMVYVPGFGWLECQGPGEVIHDESIYENGNKIGIMG